MKKMLCGFLLLASAWAHSTLAGAASVTLGQAGAGGVSAIIAPDPGEIGQPANIWMGGVLNGTLYLRNGPTNWAEYQGGPLPIALTSVALTSSLQVSIVNFDISSLPGLDVYVGYGSTEGDLSRGGHLARVYSTTVPNSWTGTASGTETSSVIVLTATAEVTWTLVGSVVNKVAVYRPTGTVRATFTSLVGCASVPTLDPPSHTLDPSTDGTLTIDYNTTPPKYHGTGLSTWPATLSCIDTSGNFGSIPGYEGEPSFFGGSGGAFGVEAAGVVSPGGVTIEGSDTLQLPGGIGTQTFTWRFTGN